MPNRRAMTSMFSSGLMYRLKGITLEKPQENNTKFTVAMK